MVTKPSYSELLCLAPGTESCSRFQGDLGTYRHALVCLVTPHYPCSLYPGCIQESGRGGAMPSLTKRTVDAALRAKGKRRIVFDDAIPGFGFRVGASGGTY